MDSFHQIQLGTVYRGKKKLDDETVLKLYKRRNIPVSYLGLSVFLFSPNFVHILHVPPRLWEGGDVCGLGNFVHQFSGKSNQENLIRMFSFFCRTLTISGH